ncbi:enoyl-CoA hydratase/isomerase family protein [Corynebacterium sp.]|uniref:enoyl-CoA hydratase/isomerase family protein n=1 Tax=Corynebacterium sp. TaxID=1720 RepID=UPI0019C3BFD0|nr:enoyl-CoA hydratase/isomerase family protein [Corynebacterium sp.]HHU66319.1 enoyl-CoA hydratase/isomerase family protein [Corynebacterium sp.]
MIDLHIEDIEGAKVAEVVLNNPKALNSLTEADLQELSDAYTEAADRGVRALVLRGEGRGFCAGRNIRGLDPRDDDATDYLANKVTPVLQQMSTFPAPTFGAVHGVCLGVGLGLAIACDIVYVAEDATFGSPFANLGATLDSGGHSLFVERLGAHRAMDLIVTGDMITGAEAVTAGLFSRALPAEELVEFTRGKARKAAVGATRAFLTSRTLVQDIRDNRRGLWESVADENIAQGELCSSDDYLEGFAAFNEKRKPVFTGN